MIQQTNKLTVRRAEITTFFIDLNNIYKSENNVTLQGFLPERYPSLPSNRTSPTLSILTGGCIKVKKYLGHFAHCVQLLTQIKCILIVRNSCYETHKTCGLIIAETHLNQFLCNEFLIVKLAYYTKLGCENLILLMCYMLIRV